MKRKDVFGGIAALFFLMILFSPTDSDLWISFLFLGITFGLLWYFEKRRG